MNQISSPCYKCMDRTIEPNCHSDDQCAKWAEYHERMKVISRGRKKYESEKTQRRGYYRHN